MVEPGVALGAIVVFGVGAQWLASRLRVPQILFLLLAGVAVGPVLDIVDPAALFGDTLYPAVSLAVGILIFEGSMGLRLSQLREGRGPVVRLVTIGALVTWVVGTVAARFLFDLSNTQAALLGAVLIVSGPTVVLPLLAQLRLRNPVDSVARWEGIIIDPVGATVGVVVLGFLLGSDSKGVLHGGWDIASTAGAGVVVGGVFAWVLMQVMQRHLVRDNLLNSVTLMLVVLAFGVANHLRPEAGLFATAVMGAVLANQRKVSLRQIERFEESLELLLLAVLFVVLGASLDLDALWAELLPALGLAAVLLVVARPLAVWVSTIGSRLTWRERVFLLVMAPRGIVAASVSALFALELSRNDEAFPELVPATYVVIFVTVTLSTVAARPLSRRFGLAKPDPRGVAVVGDDRFARALADELVANDVPVLVITGLQEDDEVTDGGLRTYQGQLDTEELDEEVDHIGIRQAVVLTSSQELSSYAVPRLAELLDRANVFYLPDRHIADQAHRREAAALAGQPFAATLTQTEVAERLDDGAQVRTMTVPAPTSRFAAGASSGAGRGAGRPAVVGGANHRVPIGEDGQVALVVIGPDGVPTVVRGDAHPTAAPGSRVIVLAGVDGHVPAS